MEGSNEANTEDKDAGSSPGPLKKKKKGVTLLGTGNLLEYATFSSESVAPLLSMNSRHQRVHQTLRHRRLRTAVAISAMEALVLLAAVIHNIHNAQVPCLVFGSVFQHEPGLKPVSTA